MNFRIFQAKATETIRGEGTAKGADAVQGKVALSVIDDFKSGTLSKVEAVKGVSVDYDKKTKNGHIYLPTGYRIYKLNANNGKIIKKFGTNGYINTKTTIKFSPIIFKNDIYFVTYQGSLISHNKITGKKI